MVTVYSELSQLCAQHTSVPSFTNTSVWDFFLMYLSKSTVQNQNYLTGDRKHQAG